MASEREKRQCRNYTETTLTALDVTFRRERGSTDQNSRDEARK